MYKIDYSALINTKAETLNVMKHLLNCKQTRSINATDNKGRILKIRVKGKIMNSWINWLLKYETS